MQWRLIFLLGNIYTNRQMSEEQQFQSADRQCSLEIVNVNNFHGSSLTPRKKIYENNISWKFQKIKRITPSTVSPRKTDNKNISFQTDCLQQITDDEKDNQSEDGIQISGFSDKYRAYELVYKKQKNIGTSWLGQREYFASIFIDPGNLGKNQKQIFKKKKISNINISFNQSNNNNSTDLNASEPLSFNSEFESGNLFSSYRVGKNQYDLILQNDINSKGNTQWFYFQLIKVPAKTKIKINIVNMLKSDSLFNYGMQPCLYSLEANKRNGQTWFRSGSSIKYFKNQNKVDGSNRNYYTLSFTVTTPFENDTLRIAQSYPYTTQDLSNFLDNLQKKPGRKLFTKRQVIGQTLGKNNIEVVKFFQQNPRKKGIRPIIIVTARQHPGETPSSYACEGFLEFIASDQKQASFLRKNYEIHVLPMLNPDGVQIGNYRTNLCGVDLNRRWDGSKSQLALQTLMVKKYLIEIARNKEVAFMVDLHGHSRKLFSFFYGNNNEQNPLEVRMFPYICAKSSEGMIRFEDSTFMNEEDKRKTARVQMSSKFKTTNVFTFQISFYGYINKNREKVHFTQQKFRYLGIVLAKSMFYHQRYKTCSDSIEALSIKKYFQELSSKPQLLKYGQKIGSGSQTQPEKGEINDQQISKILDEKGKQEQNLEKKYKTLSKIPKKQNTFKEINKQSRQLHVMDIARVNSIFPNDVLALMPSSLASKTRDKFKQKQKDKLYKYKNSVYVQTEDVPIIKIYDICKIQQLRQEREISSRKKIAIRNEKVQSENALTSRSNLFRTVIRPKSSSNTYIDPTIFSSGKTQIRRRHQSGVQIKEKKQKNRSSTAVQTSISFPPQADFMAKTLDSLMISPASKGLEIMRRKTNLAMISPDVSASKTSSQSFKIGLRALNVETWRIKKKSFQ